MAGIMTKFEKSAREATTLMREVFDATPLQRNDYLSDKFDADIYLKREDLSPVRSYKIRGAFNAMRKIKAASPDMNRFVCASAGNHAQGFAYVCRHFGAMGEVFMPVTTPQQKIEKTRAFGGDNIKIRLTGDYFDQTLAAAQSHCTEIGAHFMSPFDDPDVIEGQASVAVEVLEGLGRAPDMVVVPVGGGGLSAGMTKFMSHAAPDTAFRYIEPTGGPSLTAALKDGERRAPRACASCPRGQNMRNHIGVSQHRRDRSGTRGRAGLGRFGRLAGRGERQNHHLRHLGREFRFRCHNAPARCASFWTCLGQMTTSHGLSISRSRHGISAQY